MGYVICMSCGTGIKNDTNSFVIAHVRSKVKLGQACNSGPIHQYMGCVCAFRKLSKFHHTTTCADKIQCWSYDMKDAMLWNWRNYASFTIPVLSSAAACSAFGNREGSCVVVEFCSTIDDGLFNAVAVNLFATIEGAHIWLSMILGNKMHLLLYSFCKGEWTGFERKTLNLISMLCYSK